MGKNLIMGNIGGNWLRRKQLEKSLIEQIDVKQIGTVEKKYIIRIDHFIIYRQCCIQYGFTPINLPKMNIAVYQLLLYKARSTIESNNEQSNLSRQLDCRQN